MRVEDTTNKTDMQAPAQGEASLEAHWRYRVGLAYGRLIHRLRWFIIGLWVLGLLASIPFASNLASVLSSGGYEVNGAESTAANNVIVDKLHLPPATVVVVFQSSDTLVSDPAYQQEVNDFMARARTFAHVTGVVPGGVGKDGRTTYVTVDFNQSVDSVENRLPAFQKLVPQGSSAGPARSYVAGSVAGANALTQTVQQDTEHADSIALPIALVALLIVFGTVLAALMPLFLALIAVLTALALIYAIAVHSLTSASVISLASIVGLGISIDYSLFMTRRFREELANGRTVREAAAWTVATAGEAILFSGLTVMVGFSGLLLIGIQSMASLGYGGMLVVLTAVLAALTFLPALLSVLGERINALRVPFLWRLTMTKERESGNGSAQRAAHGFWHNLAMTVMRRPLQIILGVIVLLLALGWPVLSLNIGTSSDSSLPASSLARQGNDILAAQFPAINANPVYIVAQSADGSSMLSASNLAKVAHLTQWLAGQAHVTGVVSVMNLPATPGTPGTPGVPAPSQQQLTLLYSSGAYTQNPALQQFVAATTAGDTTLITVNNDTSIDSNAGKALIDKLRANKDEGQGLKVLVGGLQAFYLDFDRYLYSNFPKAIAFVLVATYILLLLMFRSLLLPLKAVLVNVLSLSASYGVLVFVFQWGNFKNILNFTSSGFIDSLIPILLFSVLFGLSMDYEVFLLSRVREEWLLTKDNTWAVAHGLERTGSIITSAALLFIIVTSSFMFTSLLITKELGLGMTVAILVDATIIRSLLVPATMKLLGKWNWWLPGVKS